MLVVMGTASVALRSLQLRSFSHIRELHPCAHMFGFP
jgi:hypothetical protein